MPSEEKTENGSKEANGSRFDAELLAMNKIAKLLEPLDDAARSRVLAYVVARFVDEEHAVPLRQRGIGA